jgi:hypothetical protein
MIKLLISIVLMMHGIGHLLFAANAWGIWKTEAAQSWLWSGVLRMGVGLEGLLGLFWLVPMAGYLAGAWGYFTEQQWWQPVLLVSAVTSSILVLLWWGGINTSSAFFALLVNAIVLGLILWQGEPLMVAGK